MSALLLVPVRVEARAFEADAARSPATADFRGVPASGDRVRRPFDSARVVAAPFDTVGARGGVHVRWRLPLALRTARAGQALGLARVEGGALVSARLEVGGFGYDEAPSVQVVGGGGQGAAVLAEVRDGAVVALRVSAGGEGYTQAPELRIAPATSLGFERAPNRWRVVRRTEEGTHERCWAVISDALVDGQGASADAVTVFVDSRTRPFEVLGQVRQAEDFSAPGRAVARLTAAGFGELHFEAFAPSSLNVFGLHDPADDVPPGARLVYSVVGWYSDAHEDPLVGARDPARALQERGWSVPDALCPALERTYYQGAVQGVPAAPEARKRQAPRLRAAIGATAAEALSTLVADGDADLEALLNALQLGLLKQGDCPNADLRERLGAALHAASFSAQPGAARWQVEPPASGQALAEALDRLNTLEALYTQALRAREARQAQLFLDWQRHNRATYSPGDPPVDVNAVGRLVEGMLASPGLHAPDPGPLNEQLERARGLVPEGHRLERGSGPSDWSAQEPVVLVEGPAPPPEARHLVCRLTEGPLRAEAPERQAARLDQALWQGLQGAAPPGLEAWSAQALRAHDTSPSLSFLHWSAGYKARYPHEQYGAELLVGSVRPELRTGELELQRPWTPSGHFTQVQGITPFAAEAHGTLGQAIEALIALDPGEELVARLREVQREVGQRALLSQRLEGLHDALIQRRLQLQLPAGNPYNAMDTQPRRVNQAMGRMNSHGPLPEQPFSPIRAGVLVVNALRAVDDFGEPLDLGVGARRLLRASTLLSDQVALREDEVWLRPRLSQAACLSLRWLSAADGRESSSVPSTSPVLAWLLPSLLDDSLQLFGGEGRALGVLLARGEGLRWLAAPGSPRPEEGFEDLLARLAPTLARALGWLWQGGRAERTRALLRAIRDRSAELDVGGEDDLRLFARPLALSRVGLRLQARGLPALDQSWAALDRAARERRHTPEDRLQDSAYTQVRVPVALGRPHGDDGVIGLFTDADGAFHPLGAPPPLSVTLDPAAPWTTATVLHDPGFGVTATCGVQPQKTIRLPAASVTMAQDTLRPAFLVTAALTRAREAKEDRVDLPTPGVATGAWRWIERSGAAWHVVPAERVVPAEAREGEAPGASWLREGWLEWGPDPRPRR
ncbi:MAG: hypothetical protein H6741_27455 [Alphaproteobacteria bacterium]|nr:hypothetical protein [Alphaproteobacteria bacterium]MCB9796450.1 hypothetical protein [Alphaproteobacteria bacterium]